MVLMRKWALVVALALFTSSIFTPSILAASCFPRGADVQVYVDTGTEQIRVDAADPAPFIDENNRTVVPVGSLLRAFPVGIPGHPEYDQPAVTWIDRTAEFEANGRVMSIAFGPGESVAQVVTVNGRQFLPDSKPFICGGRVFVSPRLLSQALRIGISWDGAARSVTLNPFEMYLPSTDEYIAAVEYAERNRLWDAQGVTYVWSSQAETPLAMSPFMFDMLDQAMNRATSVTTTLYAGHGVWAMRHPEDPPEYSRPRFPFVIKSTDEYSKQYVREIHPWGEWVFYQKETVKDLLYHYGVVRAVLDELPMEKAATVAGAVGGTSLTVGAAGEAVAAEFGWELLRQRFYAIKAGGKSMAFGTAFVLLGSAVVGADINMARLMLPECLRKSDEYGIAVRNVYFPPISPALYPTLDRAITQLNPGWGPKLNWEALKYINWSLRHAESGKIIAFAGCKPWKGEKAWNGRVLDEYLSWS